MEADGRPRMVSYGQKRSNGAFERVPGNRTRGPNVHTNHNEVTPLVSVLMPTFKQAAFIRRALESLRAQTLTDWELVIIDDGSPDETRDIVAAYLVDTRIRFRRLPRNRGLGAALNVATAQARGRYLAYLPSDDLYYPDHLARLVDCLEARAEIGLAYGGVRWGYQQRGPTLQGEAAVGREAEALGLAVSDGGLAPESSPSPDLRPSCPNLLALVQVMHRREWEGEVRWATRAEVVSDTLESDFWRALLARGVCFAYSGAVTCEWVDHPDQRHKIIARPAGGLPRYRRHYQIGRGKWLNWQPSRGMRIDEFARYGRFAIRRDLPASGALKILVAGELGFNPERIVAFEERGHKLYGLWIQQPEAWDAVGPFPYGNIEDIPYNPRWPQRVRALRPDVIYALLNWQALPLIREVLDAGLDIPLVFHLKEGPFVCQEHGLWPTLMHVLTRSDGQIFINAETLEWFQLATDGLLDLESTFILDGDPPKQDWMTDEWAPKLSALGSEIHTVCTGRPLGLDPFEAIARAGIHVHFYGEHFHQQFPTWTRRGLATGYMHLHTTVEPADWVRELSQYDAAWFHLFDSYNGGDLRRAHWDDLNLPARLGTYAAAGLPWIVKDNRHSRVAIQRLAQRYDVGLFLGADGHAGNLYDDLAAQLRDRDRLAQLTDNMRAVRRAFAFDTHVDELIAFFRQVIERYGALRERKALRKLVLSKGDADALPLPPAVP